MFDSHDIEEILIIPYDEVTKVDIKQYKKEIKQMRKEEEKKEIKEKELAELKRLQEKYKD